MKQYTDLFSKIRKMYEEYFEGLENADKIILAQTSSDPAELDALSKETHWGIIRCVAENINTSKETLSYLSKRDAWDVKLRVAKNPNTSKETLNILSKDDDNLIRWRVSLNENTSKNISNKIHLEFMIAQWIK